MASRSNRSEPEVCTLVQLARNPVYDLHAVAWMPAPDDREHRQLRRTRRPLTFAVAALLALAAPAPPATRDVLVVGNNSDGTADIVDRHALKVLTRLNIVPDLPQRMAEINADPAAAGFFLGVGLLIGEGHNQYVDDAFTSPDGRRLYVAPPSLADVVAFDLATRRIVWRVKVDGYRSDHMALSPDGRRLLVSASTASTVHVIDTERGVIVAGFPSGDQSHENNYSADGERIYHTSIGSVYTPLDASALDTLKGKRYFQVVDAKTYAVLSYPRLRQEALGDELSRRAPLLRVGQR